MGSEKKVRRSAQQIAQDELKGVSTRLDLKVAKAKRLKEELDTTNAEIVQLEKEKAYRASNPHLQSADNAAGAALLQGVGAPATVPDRVPAETEKLDLPAEQHPDTMLAGFDPADGKRI